MTAGLMRHCRRAAACFALASSAAVAIIAAALLAPAPIAQAAVKKPPPVTVTQVTAGKRHSCVLRSDGGIRCWGQNANGQLGTGNIDDRGTATAVTGAAGIRQVSAGGDHTCAITSTYGIQCWGSNIFGELGSSGPDGKAVPTAVSLPADAKAVQVSAGSYHTCALLNTGTVLCWGRNNHGQLGTGNADSSATPTAISSLKNVKGISAGNNHTCAALKDGTARCWGQGDSGAIGDGFRIDRTSPARVGKLVGVVSVAAGFDSTCAVISDGSGRCWGNGVFGQLGNGGLAPSASPAVIKYFGVRALRGQLSQISVGWQVACGINRAGAEFCWGSSQFGGIGDGSQYAVRSTPVGVRTVAKATSLAAGEGHTCTIDAGVTKCWGYNDFGEVGDNTFITRLAPVNVKGVLP